MFRFRRKLKKIYRKFAQSLSRSGAALVRPVERGFKSVGKGLFAGFERIEKWVRKLGKLIRKPFRTLWKGLRATTALLVPKSLRKLFKATLRGIKRFSRRMLKKFLRAAVALSLDRPVLWLVKMLRPVWRPLAAVGMFFYAWGATRKYKKRLWGLPSLVLMLVIGLVLAKTYFLGNAGVPRQYRLAIREAMEAKDYELAQLYERKLAQLGVDTKLSDYRTAESLGEDGKLEEAYARMQRLAEADEEGYPAAHFWIIQRLIGGQLTEAKLVESSEVARSLAEEHLDRLESLKVTGDYHQLMRALWLAQGNQLQEAAALLEPLVTVMPYAAIEKMRIDLNLNRHEQARHDARSLDKHMSKLARGRISLTTTDYQWWLAAVEVLGNFKKMRMVIDQWLELEPDNQQARRALSIVCRREAQQLLRAPLPDTQQIADLWIDAVELDLSEESLLQMAHSLHQNRDRALIYDQVLAALSESSRTPASMLTTLGTDAAVAQRYDEALPILAAAVEKDGTNAVALNNYALVLGQGDAANLETALAAVNRALEIAPNDHKYRETRGQILVRLERWKKAVDDLEFALNGMPSMTSIHESLAVAYAALGNDELASMHRNRSN